MLWVAHGLGYVFMKGEVIHGFPAAFRTLGAGFVGAIPVPVLIGIALLLVLHVVLHLTLRARALRHRRQRRRREAHRHAGEAPSRHRVRALGRPRRLAGLVVIARVNAADSGTGEELLLTAIAAVCLGGSLFGGAGGIVGTAIGALILALVVNGMNMLSIATFWQAFAMGVIVILAVLADVSFKRRMSCGLLAIVLAAMLALPGAALAQAKPKIVVFTKNVTNPFWKAVRVGADKAGSSSAPTSSTPRRPSPTTSRSRRAWSRTG